jgi:hypothetical protein
MAGGIINLKWTWLILAAVCIALYLFVLITYYFFTKDEVKMFGSHQITISNSTHRGYGNLLTFSNWFILPLGIGLGIAYYVFAIVMDNSKQKISKATRKKGNNSDN